MKRVEKRSGFTLVEMLVVLGIIVIVVSMTTVLFVGSRTTARRSAAVNSVKAALAAARQAAVELRTAVSVEFIISSSPDRGDYMLVWDKSVDATLLPNDPARQIGPAVKLPDFIKLEPVPLTAGAIVNYWTLENGWNDDEDDVNDASGSSVVANRYPDITFLPDGTAGDPEMTTDIVLFDTAADEGQGVRTVLRVLPATGLIVDARHVGDITQPESPTNPKLKGWL